MNILEMVPEEFDLSADLDSILAVVLSQELERYNELLETMKDSLQNALNGLAGNCLLSEEMEEFIEQIKEDEIPKVEGYINLRLSNPKLQPRTFPYQIFQP